MPPLSRPLPASVVTWLLLLLFALLILGLGIWEPTGLTGKDEFFLGLRTPMEMLERQEWLVPFLDGAPRIRKPPLLYWLARGSYELFGVSLFSARLVTVCFGALMALATLGIGRRLSGDTGTALFAAGILLSFLGMASESRRLMLDIPVAALSACAFWSFLIWQEKQQSRWLILAALSLAAGVLVKGPIAGLLFGGGILALLGTRRLEFRQLRPHWLTLLGSLLLFLTLALPWFVLVRKLHPEAVALVVADEMEARQLLSISFALVPGLLQIALPWSFIGLTLAWQARRQIWHTNSTARLLLGWLLATWLPFLLIRTFDRYLVGSLIPLALLLAWLLRDRDALPPWSARLGLTISLLFGGALGIFAWRFQLGGWYFLIPTGLYFIWAWSVPRARGHWLAAPMVYWISLLWGLFPALGVNAIPPAVQVLGKTRTIAMYDGPQPALLPILSGRTLSHWPRVDEDQARTLMGAQGLVFSEENDVPRLQQQLAAVGLKGIQAGQYQVLASHGSGLRFIRPGVDRTALQAAWNHRDLSPLMTTVQWFELRPLAAPAP